ncbi:MAG TPA: DUF4396 domain-containing protein [Roseiarcus sp.]
MLAAEARYLIIGRVGAGPVARRSEGRRLGVWRPSLSNALETFAFVYIWLSIAAALIVLADIFLLGRRQSMGVMDAVWPLTMLYWGPLGLPFYFSFGRAAHSHAQMQGHEHGHDAEPPMWQAVFKGAAHCGAGCALGDFAAEWIALGLGLVLLGSALAARLTLSFVLAYAAGIAFQYFAIAPMRGLSLRAGLVAAVKADTLSLIAYEIGMFAWMIYRAHAWPAMQPTDWSYWLMMQIAMVLGFATTYPVNWLLIRFGVKERM